jgi:Secretion system C-terminal sorting domain
MVHDYRNKSVLLSFNNPKRPLIMPIRYLFVSCFLLLMGHSVQAARGIFQTYAIVNVNNTGNQYRAGGANADNATSFSGNNFGTAATSIFLNGGEIKTFKNGSSDVTGAKIYYRVYPSGSPAGTFVEVNLPFGQDLGGGNQKWTATNAAINIAAGLAPGTYQLEVYWKITSNEGDVFDSNGGNNYKATFTTTSSTLPVTLSRFTATPGPQRTAQLDWATASERNNARFEIERGPDALHFVGIGQVEGSGTTVEARSYSFIDRSPNPGPNYYRLRQVDQDGTVSVSPIRTVLIRTNGDLLVLGNPAINQLVISGLEDSSAVLIADMQGRTVHQQRITRSVCELDVTSWSAGVYLLTVTESTGVRSLVRVLVQH